MFKQASHPFSVLLVCTIPVMPLEGDNPQKKLKDHLFKDYDKHTRPVRNHRHPVVVNISIGMKFINDLDEKQQVLHTNIWTR